MFTQPTNERPSANSTSTTTTLMRYLGSARKKLKARANPAKARYTSNHRKRQYFPKGTNLNLHPSERLAEVAAKINVRPRESRNWESAQAHFDRFTKTAPIVIE